MTNSHDDLHKIVTQKEKDRVISGALDSSTPALDDGMIPDAVIRETLNILKYHYDSGEWVRDDKTRVVTQVAKDRTISNVVDVAPTGDMARKSYYDRNSSLISQFYEQGNLSSHGWTVRWTYTVPENKKAMHSVIHGQVYRDIATAAKTAQVQWEVLKYEGSYYKFAAIIHTDGNGYLQAETITSTFLLGEGDAIRGSTYSNDTVIHGHVVSSLLTEFDE